MYNSYNSSMSETQCRDFPLAEGYLKEKSW